MEERIRSIMFVVLEAICAGGGVGSAVVVGGASNEGAGQWKGDGVAMWGGGLHLSEGE